MGFQDWDPNNLKVLKKVSEAFLTAYKDSPMSTTLSNQVYQVEIAYNKYLADNSGTRVAPEITLNDPDGKEIRLSSLRNNYVLIDFWASWCGPCRKESPNVVRMYNKYKNKGFTVYSVSLDDNVEAWRTAIASDGLTWPNHVSDLLKWKSPLPQLYGFEGIPYTVLIDKEGKIIGTGLRGASLEQKLNEIFGN
jgi:thiol-disulfide isomerase/thioredoxin